MLDFLKIITRTTKKGYTEVCPKFVIKKSNDLMIRGGDFYAIWVEDRGLWSTDEQDVIDLVDRELDEYVKANQHKHDETLHPLWMWDSSSGTIDAWHKYCQKQSRDSFHMLDEKLIFSNTETNKKDYATKRLSYPLEEGDIPGWEKLISTLYSEEERHKIEWAIGSIITGDSKTLQKFMVLYGAAGTGKSTILNIIQHLFDGYYSVFDAKALGSSSNAFALEAFKSNPLVAIQHDGDLSKIEDNTRLNSLVSHELMTINEKFKSTYASRFKCFLFMGTNKPVKITDGRSGLLRRLIDVSPSGNKLNAREYKKAVKQAEFELGSIAWHCREVYLEDPNAYDDYVPISMMGASNDFYNFILDSYHIFRREDGTTLKAAWEMYKQYAEDAKLTYPMSQRNFKEELKNYFWDFKERFAAEDGSRIRSYYSGFRRDKFEDAYNDEPKKPATKTEEATPVETNDVHLIKMDAAESIFDKECADCFAQYASSNETPLKKWENVKTKLSKLDTRKLHYVKVPENHIVIDFDIKDRDGNKSLEENLKAASEWPATYAELSKSGAGVHLHYIYSGDVTKLSRIYDDNIEIKVFTGKSSLRRMLTKCNDLPIATINAGLPLKGDDKVVNWDGIKNEKMLRTMIKRNLNKEYHGATKPSVDYIHHLLEEAYKSGIGYDVTDLRNAVFNFAANSTNQAEYCIKLVNSMKFKSEEANKVVEGEGELVFFDCEVFPNLFLVNWKVAGEGKQVVRMINPSPSDIEQLLKFKLVGFNCRRYDNHMLYARLLGYDNAQLFDLSNRIVNSKKGDRNNGLFGEAYNLSYTDVYDFSTKKQSLKKWEIELNIHHQELGLPWDQPVPEELWEKVAEYCDNDVIATEEVFNHLKADWIARQILADLAGMSVNDTTNTLTTRIIFGRERRPQLIYTDLATGEQNPCPAISRGVINAFPGYEFVYDESDKKFHNMYRGTDVGMGGYVYAEPGVYGNVALLDVASMHPSSIIAMDYFGEYTKNYQALIDIRIAIKHKDYDAARKMFDGKLAKYLDDEETADMLSKALKLPINGSYGLTAASFENAMRDNRNKNNIVALRGALFMRTLQDEVNKRGFKVAHIKTDSIKIPDATPEIVKFVSEFGKQYGYNFELEAVYDRMCLVNNAVYIAKYATVETCYSIFGEAYVNKDRDTCKENKKHPNTWTATGTQFQIPYTFKTLFSKEPIVFEDMCEAKEVKTAIYLDMNEKLPEGEHDLHFIGKVGNFCPIKPGRGGAELVKEMKAKDGSTKYDAVTGAKDYRWLESEMVKTLGKEKDIDKSYYEKLINDAIDAISTYGDYTWFVSDDPYTPPLYIEGRPVYFPVTEDSDLPWYSDEELRLINEARDAASEIFNKR